jgi:hypothetical protein
MKKYITYINENNSLKQQWIDSIINYNVDNVEYLISKGVDINYSVNFLNQTALNYYSFNIHNFYTFKK